MNQEWIAEPGTARALARSRRRVLLGSSAATALLLPRLPFAWPGVRDAAAAETSEAFIVVRRYRLAPGVALADVVRQTEEGFVPILREIAGFAEYYNIALGDDEGLTISVFASETGAAESTTRAAAWVQANLAGSFQGPPEVVAGPVRLHVAAGSGSEPGA